MVVVGSRAPQVARPNPYTLRRAQNLRACALRSTRAKTIASSPKPLLDMALGYASL
jgi:hypothetical protein